MWCVVCGAWCGVCGCVVCECVVCGVWCVVCASVCVGVRRSDSARLLQQSGLCVRAGKRVVFCFLCLCKTEVSRSIFWSNSIELIGCDVQMCGGCGGCVMLLERHVLGFILGFCMGFVLGIAGCTFRDGVIPTGFC